MRLTALHRFPVKSCAGEELEEAVVEPWGLAGDRCWMVVDAEGECVTARERKQLLLVRPVLRADGGVDLGAPGREDLEVGPPTGATTDVTVFGRQPHPARLAGAAADAWFSEVVGEPVRLVFAHAPEGRQANAAFAGPDVPMAFADGYPLNVGSEASLADLNDRIAEGPRPDEGRLPMLRFRPNLSVDGEQAWVEDGWRRLRVGEATFRVVKGCDRCAIPTTDPDTAERSKEPTATLARHRRFDGATWFGMQLVPESPGATLRVGDEVEVLEAVEAPDGPPR